MINGNARAVDFEGRLLFAIARTKLILGTVFQLEMSGQLIWAIDLRDGLSVANTPPPNLEDILSTGIVDTIDLGDALLIVEQDKRCPAIP